VLRRLERIETFLNSARNGTGTSKSATEPGFLEADVDFATPRTVSKSQTGTGEAKLPAFPMVNVDFTAPPLPAQAMTPESVALGVVERPLPPLHAVSGGQGDASGLHVVPAEEEASYDFYGNFCKR
jgi:hypothetical protein